MSSGWGAYYEKKKKMDTVLKTLHSKGWAIPDYTPDMSEMQFDYWSPEDCGDWALYSPDPLAGKEYYIAIVGSRSTEMIDVSKCEGYTGKKGADKECMKYTRQNEYNRSDMVKIAKDLRSYDLKKDGVTNRTAWVLLRADRDSNGDFKYTFISKGGRYDANKILSNIKSSGAPTVKHKTKGDAISEYKTSVEEVSFSKIPREMNYLPPPLMMIENKFSAISYKTLAVVYAFRESLNSKSDRKLMAFIGIPFGGNEFQRLENRRYMGWVCQARIQKIHFFYMLKSGNSIWFMPRTEPPRGSRGKIKYPVYNGIDLETTKDCSVCKGYTVHLKNYDICIPDRIVIGGQDSKLNKYKYEYKYMDSDSIAEWNMGEAYYSVMIAVYREDGNKKRAEEDFNNLILNFSGNALPLSIVMSLDSWIKNSIKEEYL